MGFQSYSKSFWYYRIVKDILKRHLGLVWIKIAVFAILIGDLIEINQNLLKNVNRCVLEILFKLARNCEKSFLNMIGDLFGPDARLEMNRTNITRAARAKSTCRIRKMLDDSLILTKNHIVNLTILRQIPFYTLGHQIIDEV